MVELIKLLDTRKHGKHYRRYALVMCSYGDKGYYKENCRWATKAEQALNRHKQGTFKKKDINAYSRKVTIADIQEYSDKYEKAKYGEKRGISKEFAQKYNLSINTSNTYLSSYIKGTLCKSI